MTDFVNNCKIVTLRSRDIYYGKVDDDTKWVLTPSQGYIWISSTRESAIDRLENAIGQVSWVTWERGYATPHIIKDMNNIFPNDMGGKWLGWDYFHDIGSRASDEVRFRLYVPEQNINDMNTILNNYIRY